jgi:hypothetical protein
MKPMTSWLVFKSAHEWLVQKRLVTRGESAEVDSKTYLK